MMNKLFDKLQQLSAWLTLMRKASYNNLLSIVVLIFLYLFLWHFDQAQDLLLTLNQQDMYDGFFQVPYYFFCLFVLALVIWNFPKYLYYWNIREINFKNLFKVSPDFHYEYYYKELDRPDITTEEKKEIHIRLIFPRILGCMVFLVSAFGIIKAFNDFGYVNLLVNKLHYEWLKYLFIPHFYLISSIILLLQLLDYDKYNKKFKKVIKSLKNNRIILISIIGVILMLITVLGILNNYVGQHLIFLFIANIFVFFLFFILSFNRKEIFVSPLQRRFFYNIFLVSVILLNFIMIFLNFKIHWSQHINPLSILVMGLILYQTIAVILQYFGRKYKIALLSGTVILIFLLTVFALNKEYYKFYEIESIESTINPTQDRQYLEFYIDDWLKEKMAQIQSADSQNKYPIYFVAAQGGGSKSGLWAAAVQSYLQNQTKGRYFKDHLFLLTGASGGSVGNALFFNTMAQNPKFNTYNFDSNFSKIDSKFGEFYETNFLSSSLVALFGRDAIQATIGIPFTDNRAETLENEWNTAYSDYLMKDNTLEKDFLAPYYSEHHATKLPLLIINTTHVQSGQYTYISPVRMNLVNRTKPLRDIFSDIKSAYHYQEREDSATQSIKLGTAMTMNAAFPVVTSALELKKMGQYADSGYYDNIGGVIVEKVMNVFRQRLNEYIIQLYQTKKSIGRNQIEKNKVEFNNFKNEILSKIQLVPLVILNEPLNPQKEYKSENQFSVPLSTLFNSRNGHTIEEIGNLSNSINIVLEPSLYISKEEEGTNILPLGRYLSTNAVKTIEDCVFKRKELRHMIIQMNYFDNDP